MPSTDLTQAQRDDFHRHGYLRLAGAFDPADAAAMRERLWSALGRAGVMRDDPSTWDRPWSGLRSTGSQRLFRRILSPGVRGALDALLGADNWREPACWNMFLASPPDAEDGTAWSIPRDGWHWDARPGPLTGVNLYVFYSDIRPRGGGTLLAEGSHRPIARFFADLPADAATTPEGRLKARFAAAHPWTAALTGARPGRSGNGLEFLMPEADADGTRLRVVEMTGAAGDVILWHPWMLHVRPARQEGAPRFASNKTIRPLRPR